MKTLKDYSDSSLETSQFRTIISELQDEVANLTQQNALLTQKIADLTQKNATLLEQIEWFKKQFFGKKSERQVNPRSSQEGRKANNDKKKSRTSTEEDKITFPEGIPIERIILDLPEEEKVCPYTGKPLEKIGEECVQKLAFKPGSYFIKEFIKPKYISRDCPE